MIEKPSMWPDEYAHVKSTGKPYRPSNGTEGEIFEGQWCSQCHHQKRCGIFVYAMAFEVDHPNYPHELRIDERGQPECTNFKEPVPPPPPKPKNAYKPLKGQESLPL